MEVKQVLFLLQTPHPALPMPGEKGDFVFQNTWSHKGTLFSTIDNVYTEIFHTILIFEMHQIFKGIL